MGRLNMAMLRTALSVGVLLSIGTAWGEIIMQKAVPAKGGAKPPPLVNADPDQAIYLSRVEQMIAEKSYRDAIQKLQDLIEKADGFFEAGADGRRYISTRVKANELLGRMGQEGLDLYRSLYDTQAQKLYEDALAAYDIPLLQRVADRYLYSTSGPKATDALAGLYFDSGKFLQAGFFWRQLAMLDPKAPLAAARMAKSVIALHMAGEKAAADAAMAELQKDFPQAKGFLDGQDRPLAEFIQQVRKSAVLTVVGSSADFASGWPGQAALSGGYGPMSAVDVILSPRWRRPEVDLSSGGDVLKNLLIVKTQLLPPNVNYGGPQPFKTVAELRNGHVRVRTSGGQNYGYPQGIREYGLPSMIHPAVADGKVIIRTATRVEAYGLLDGELKWASEQPLVRALSSAAQRLVQPMYQPLGKMVDNGRYAVTIGGGKVFVLSHFRPPAFLQNMGLFMGPAAAPPKDESLEDNSRLVALWAASGKLVDGWDVGCGKGNDEILKRGKFLSAPAYANQRLYVLAIYLDGYHLLCLSANDGSLIWKQLLAQAPVIPNNYGQSSSDLYHLGTSPVVADGKVFATTNMGVVAACDANSGQPLWAYQYDQSEMPGRNQPYPMPGAGNLKAASPMIVVHGRVICMPSDSNKAVALSAEDGSLAWQVERHNCADLTGIDEGRFLLSGEGLFVLSTQDGQDLFGGAEITGVVGRPVVAGDCILASGPGLLYRVSLQDYRLSKVELADAEGLLGDLVSAGGKLIAANALGVCSYFKFEDARDELTRRIEAAKGDDKLDATLHRAQLAFSAGRYDDAVADFQSCARNGYAEKARPGLYRTYVAMGNAAGKGDEMVKHFHSALAIAGTPAEKAQMKLRLAKALVTAGNLEQAAAMAQALSEEFPKEEIVDAPVGPQVKDTARFTGKQPTEPAKELAQEFIRGLIRSQGRAGYKAFDEQAQKECASALQEASADHLEAVWARWPHSACAHDALYAAAELCYKASQGKTDDEAGRQLVRAKHLLNLVRNEPSSPRYVAATVAMAALYSQEPGSDKNDRLYAAHILDAMRDQPPSTEVAFADLRGSLKDVLERIDAGQLPKLTAPQKPQAVVPMPLREAFTLADADCFILRDQDGRPVRIGESIAILKGSRVILLDASAKDEELATANWSGLTSASGADLRKRQNWALQATCGLSADRKVLAVADCEAVIGLSTTTAKILWQKKMTDFGIVGQPSLAIGAGYLVMTDQSRNIACVNLATGEHWQNTLAVAKFDPRMGGPQNLVGIPQIGGGLVVVPINQSKSLAVYSLKTGKIVQKYDSNRGAADAMITPEGLLVTLVNQELALREGGQLDKPLWTRKYEDANNPPRMLLAVSQDLIAVSLQRNQVEVLGVRGGGKVANTLRMDASATAVDGQFDGKILYVSCAVGPIQSRRANLTMYGAQLMNLSVLRFEVEGNGDAAWKRAVVPDPQQGTWPMPLAVGPRQVVVTMKSQRPDLPGNLVILDAKTGNVLDKNLSLQGRTPESRGDRSRVYAIGAPVLLDGRLCVETLEGVTIYGK